MPEKKREDGSWGWREMLIAKAEDGDKGAKASLNKIMKEGSEEDIKAFASLGYSRAESQLEDAPKPDEGSQPGKPSEVEVSGDAGLKVFKDSEAEKKSAAGSPR